VKGHHRIDVGEGGLEKARPIGFVKRGGYGPGGKTGVFVSKRLADGTLAILLPGDGKNVSVL
jgi:hypothetical protein